MEGFELFKYLMENHPSREYKQTLMTIHLHVREGMFPMLEKAHLQGKFLQLNEPKGFEDIPHDGYSIDDVEIVEVLNS